MGRVRAAALVIVAAVSLLAVAVVPAPAAAATRWTGGVDLYRSGVFTTQKTWLWCTAADVQIIRNIVRRETDHSRAGQQRYFDYMRAHNRYRIPVKDGVDPAGWTAGLRHYVDGRYGLVSSGSFDAALRSAVTTLRRTNLPVGLTVSHGNHAWVLTGFTASADPAITTRFTVTSVRVVGPLWGVQSRRYGYDMRPDTRLTPAQLRGFFTPWHYAGVRMAWEGRWVSIQPIAPGAGGALIAGVKPMPSATTAPTTPARGATTTPTPVAAAAGSESPATVVPAADPHAATVPPSGDPAWGGVGLATQATQGTRAPSILIVAMLLLAITLAAGLLSIGARATWRRG
jgi:hypothetical protein